MWKNFFSVALRNIGKNRIFSLINIAGLAIGLASAILIILFVAKEISFDRFHEHTKRIYRAYVEGNIGEQEFKGAWTSYPLGPVVTKEIDEIQDFVRLDVYPQQFVWHNDVKQIEDNVIFADSAFFKIFSIELLYGDPNGVLNKPNFLVISESKALQYFGRTDVLGETLEFNFENNFYEITGVMKDFPDNSHFKCDFLLSMSTLPESRGDDWFSNSIYTYFLLSEDASYKQVEQKMNKVLMKNISQQLKTLLGIGTEEWVKAGNSFSVFLQPLTDIHLNPDIDTGGEACLRPVNDKNYIYIFILIAIAILAIASINFMNLSTARSSIRAREIAMRKVVGSQRKLLILQFLAESVILSLLALVLALFIVEISLPLFNREMGLDLNIHEMGRVIIFSCVLLISLLVGVLSGFYPAFYLSRYKPLEGLRGGSLKGKNSAVFRSVMVVVQFTISVAIIVGMLIITRQLSFLLNKDLGFNSEQIVVIDRIYPLENKIEVFCGEAEKIPGVLKATNSSTYLGFSNLTTSLQVKGSHQSKNYMFDVNFVDPDFFETYGLKQIQKGGRFFSDKNSSDTMTVVINETAVKEYGFKDPLNTVIQDPVSEEGSVNYRVIGVVKDFHHSTLRKEITPYLFMMKTKSNTHTGYISVLLAKNSSGNASAVKQLNELWNDFTGDEPFQYFYLQDELNKYYREEKRTGRISLLFSVLAIIIASLGLLGLTIFNTERRIREIAIRKAMGANIYSLLMIISREILILLGISIVLAWVIAFFFMKNWLQVFPYNIGFTPGVYLVAAIVAVAIAMITVNAITLKAANKNPVDALYHE